MDQDSLRRSMTKVILETPRSMTQDVIEEAFLFSLNQAGLNGERVIISLYKYRQYEELSKLAIRFSEASEDLRKAWKWHLDNNPDCQGGPLAKEIEFLTTGIFEYIEDEDE